MKQKLTLLIAAASLALPLSASTTDSLRTANIDEVLVYGTRSILPLKKVPSKIEVISAETIQRSGFTSLPDLLKNYSSVDVIQYPGFNATVGIRGFKPGKAYTTVLINGIPTASENISTIALSDIAQVEILKGPFSSVYGTNAMGGVINIVTVQHKEQLTGRVSATAGSYDTYAGTLALGGRIVSGLSFDLSAGYTSEHTNYKAGNNDILRHNSLAKAIVDPETRGATIPGSTYGVYTGSLRLGYDFSPNWSVNAYENLFIGDAIRTGGSIYGVYGLSQKDITRSLTSLEVLGQVGIHHLALRPYYSFEVSQNYDKAGSGAIINYRRNGQDYGAILQDDMTLGAHRLTLGADYKKSDTKTKSFDATGAQKASYNPDYSTSSLGFFAQTNLSVTERFIVSAGARLDLMRFDLSADSRLNSEAKHEQHLVFSPNLGLKYELARGLRLHASAGTAFAAPDAYRKAGQYTSGKTTTVGNRDLRPESSLTIDGGIGYTNYEKGIDLDATYFYTDHKDMIVDKVTTNPDKTATKTFINSDKARMHGLELMAAYDFGSLVDYAFSLKAYANATLLLHSKMKLAAASDWTPIKYVRSQNVTFGLDFTTREGLQFGLSGRYIGQRWEDNWFGYYPNIRTGLAARVAAEQPDWGSRLQHPSALIFGASLHYTIKQRLGLGVNVDNLYDEHYTEKDGYHMPGRTVRFKLSYQF